MVSLQKILPHNSIPLATTMAPPTEVDENYTTAATAAGSTTSTLATSSPETAAAVVENESNSHHTTSFATISTETNNATTATATATTAAAATVTTRQSNLQYSKYLKNDQATEILNLQSEYKKKLAHFRQRRRTEALPPPLPPVNLNLSSTTTCFLVNDPQENTKVIAETIALYTKKCSHQGCQHLTEKRRKLCNTHYKRCSSDGCTKRPVSGGVCADHGGKRVRKTCSHDGCPSYPQGKGGKCIKHGGGRRCSHEGCTTLLTTEGNRKAGFCATHGGTDQKRKRKAGAYVQHLPQDGNRKRIRYKCNHPECTSVSQKEGLCYKHWKMSKAGALNGGQKKKKAKKQKVEAPMSAHMQFSLANRAVVKERQPNLSAAEVSSAVAANWKAMPVDQRAVWEAKAAADEERYQKELADNHRRTAAMDIL